MEGVLAVGVIQKPILHVQQLLLYNKMLAHNVNQELNQTYFQSPCNVSNNAFNSVSQYRDKEQGKYWVALVYTLGYNSKSQSRALRPILIFHVGIHRRCCSGSVLVPVEIEMEITIASSVSLSIWFLHQSKVSQWVDSADGENWGGKVDAGHAGEFSVIIK